MLTIDQARPGDFPRTAELHKAYLRLGLFPRLGRHFLRHYQETFARSPYGIALVARDDDDEVVGALFGTTSNADHYRWVVRNCGWELALAGSTALLTRPQLAWTFASTRLSRYARGLSRHIATSDDAPRAATGGPVSVLSHIVTDKEQRRLGIGRRLVERFKRLAGAEGASRAVLVTEEGGLGDTFFERIGCDCVAHRQGQDGAVICEYRMDLNEETAAHEGMDRQRLGSRPAPYPHDVRFGASRPLALHRASHQ